jgi:hypothetical protein
VATSEPTWTAGTDPPSAKEPVVSESSAYSHVSELEDIIDRIGNYQNQHADLLSANPTVANLWHVGQQVISALSMLQTARDLMRTTVKGLQK